MQNLLLASTAATPIMKIGDFGFARYDGFSDVKQWKQNFSLCCCYNPGRPTTCFFFSFSDVLFITHLGI